MLECILNEHKENKRWYEYSGGLVCIREPAGYRDFVFRIPLPHQPQVIL